MNTMKQIVISKRAELAARGGHPWIYGSEIEAAEAGILPGDIVRVVSKKGKFVGSAFYNPASKITLRIISTNANDTADAAFWRRRAAYAADYRLQVMREEDRACMRLIFGEADGFPGLTADLFGDILAVEVLSLGIELRKEEIFTGLIEVLRERGLAVSALYQRNDGRLRGLEGMEAYTGFWRSPLLDMSAEREMTEIVENGIRYAVDVAHGQKTGFFLDQKFNRLAAGRIARGRHVLDCCTHTGAFALNAARGGAASVTAVDISEDAVRMAGHNAALNGIPLRTVCADVFDFLTELDRTKSREYDYIILDPPAFTKSGGTVRSAFRGYKEINYRAMKILLRGGYLATCSCSHFMTEELFIKMAKEAARDAGVALRLIESRRQSPDHPILMTVPETYYLKFFLFQIV